MLQIPERVSSEEFVPHWVHFEHESRYDFAAKYVKNRDVLDIACGTGRGSRRFAQAGANHVLAMDKHDGMYEDLKMQHGIHFMQTDCPIIPCDSQTLDTVISLETIEHLHNEITFLEEVKRVLRPGGTFICSTPNRWITNPGTSRQDMPCNPHHIREYSLQEMKALLADHFSHVQVWGQNAYYVWWSQALHYAGTRMSRKIALNIHRFVKALRFVWDNPKNHNVQLRRLHREYEYLVFVCN